MVGKQSTILTLTVMITLTFWSVMRHKVIMGVFYFSDDSFLNLKQAYRRFFLFFGSGRQCNVFLASSDAGFSGHLISRNATVLSS